MHLKGKVVGSRKFSYVGSEKEVSYLLRRGIGKLEGKKLMLNKQEALYLWEFMGVEVPSAVFSQDFSKYITFRDLFNKGFRFKQSLEGSEKPVKTYNSTKTKLKGKLRVVYSDGSFTCVEGSDSLYKEHWFGQIGAYKKGTGKLYLLDKFEAKYLSEKGLLSGSFRTPGPHFNEYYKVYKEWRDAGFVLKTGFKFGGDFRIYPGGTNPSNITHSKHVLHVFPQKLITTAENWSRSIRVCHAVRKTYILAVPTEEQRRFKPDFIVAKDSQEAVVKVLKQDQKISGADLQAALSYCIENSTELMLAMVDRETSVTYYRARRISLEGSSTLYYEVEWLNLK